MVEQATENRRVPSSNLGPGTSILYMNGDKLASLRGCFFVDNRVFARGLGRQNIPSKGIKRHLAKDDFRDVSGMLVE